MIEQEFATPGDALAHYGTKGMKWGVRKNDKTSPAKAGAVDPVSAALVATLLLKFGHTTVKYAKDQGKKYEKNAVPFNRNESLTKPMDVDALHANVVKQINPGFGAKGTKMNCRRCTMVYELRRRGYDVKATPSVYAAGQGPKGIRNATYDFGGQHKPESPWGHKQIGTEKGLWHGTTESRANDIYSTLNKQPDGSRGELTVGWTLGGGHSMAYEVVKGKAVIFDGQSGDVYRDAKSLHEITPIVGNAAYTRTDNLKLNPQIIRRWAVNA